MDNSHFISAKQKVISICYADDSFPEKNEFSLKGCDWKILIFNIHGNIRLTGRCYFVGCTENFFRYCAGVFPVTRLNTV